MQSLSRPHKCPDPKPRITTANNYVLRCARRQIGYQSKTMERRFVHSRFCPVQTIRSSTDESFFTCLKFLVSRRLNNDTAKHIFNFQFFFNNLQTKYLCHLSIITMYKKICTRSICVKNKREE